MYRVGFGDCFLVTLPLRGGDRHVLVDCGVHPAGDARSLPRVVADIRSVTGGRLALVVATHEHADHISGFGTFASEFAGFDIDELWMPWAMDPDDGQAARLRRKRMRLALQLTEHLRTLGARAPAGVGDVLLNLTRNEAALDALHGGFGGAVGRTRYLSASDRPLAEHPLPGASVRVLGPPRGERFLRRMDPPASQRFFKLDNGQSVAANGIDPFPAKHTFGSAAEGRRAYGFPRAARRGVSERDIDRVAAESIEALAFTLDSVANNTSLCLLVSVAGHHLLFPGDAQWGNWQSWLDGPSCPPLDGITFMKVSHHGSVNATPRQAVSGMTHRGLALMCSTQDRPFPSIPRRELMDALRAGTRRLVRADEALLGTARLPRGFRRGPDWVDYVETI